MREKSVAKYFIQGLGTMMMLAVFGVGGYSIVASASKTGNGVSPVSGLKESSTALTQEATITAPVIEVEQAAPADLPATEEKKPVQNTKQPARKKVVIGAAVAATQQMPSNTIECNGKIWATCVEGSFYCPATGDAYCIPNPVVQAPQQIDSGAAAQAAQQLADQQAALLAAQQAAQQAAASAAAQKAQLDAFLDAAQQQIEQAWQVKNAQLDELQAKIDPLQAQYDACGQMAVAMTFIVGCRAKISSQLNPLIDQYNALLGGQSYRIPLPQQNIYLKFDSNGNGGGTLYDPFGSTYLHYDCSTGGSCTIYN